MFGIDDDQTTHHRDQRIRLNSPCLTCDIDVESTQVKPGGEYDVVMHAIRNWHSGSPS